MSRYRRNFVKGGTYFFTVVTYKRRNLLKGGAVGILRKSFGKIMKQRPFKIEAIVVLPDHLHCIWQLPPEDDYKNHFDYIHYNPVKHRLAKNQKDWEYTSFHRYVREGIYELEWGAGRVMLFDEIIGKE